MKMPIEIKDEIGWKDGLDAAFLARRVMEICDNVAFLEQRICDLEDTMDAKELVGRNYVYN